MIKTLLSKSSKTFVYLSPLRALAEEFTLSISKVKTTLTFNEIEKKLFPNIIYVGTVEKWLSQKKNYNPQETIFIFDEFHLYYYWGEEFRPLLQMCYEEVASSESSCLYLSATMNKVNFQKWRNESLLNFNEVLCLNLGNQKLKNRPYQKFYVNHYFKKTYDLVIKKQIHRNQKGAILIFVKKREDVDKWGTYLKKNNVNFLTCKGGEAKEFTQKLILNPEVKVIVATSVLSHGVNLPAVSSLFLCYSLENRDFWIQNVGRGGRRGERFQLYSMDKEDFSFREIAYSCFKLLFLSLWYKMVALYE